MIAPAMTLSALDWVSSSPIPRPNIVLGRGGCIMLARGEDDDRGGMGGVESCLRRR